VDHIVDHKGDWRLFVDRNNLESLCHSCHSRKTLREMGLNGQQNGAKSG
jgi:5-methylcytosine-specific restriction protein A